jgi:hypothetical protein
MLTPKWLLKALEYGVLGLSAIMLILCVEIIFKEQDLSGPPRVGIILWTAMFMFFCLVLAVLNAYVQLNVRPIPPADSNKQAEVYVAEDLRIRELPAQKIGESLSPTIGGQIWGEFYRYRATVRSLLRHLCLAHGIRIRTDQGITEMGHMLLENQKISPSIAADVEKIARATYTAQWGAGQAPTTDEAKFVADNAKRIIEELSQALSNSPRLY